MMEAVIYTENGGIVQKVKLGLMEVEMEAIGVMEAETINRGGNHDDLSHKIPCDGSCDV